ncbi:MAG: vWA domain-containing protein [Pseudomonadota bacterium]
MKLQHANKQRGQITIIAGLLMIGLLGVVGLAVDAGMAYVTKAKLNAAVDSAAIAAAKAVTNGTTQADQAANARQAASNFFYANYPNGYLRGTPALNPVTVNFDTPTLGAITIGVSGTATMPLSLMKILGFNNIAVAATSQTIRKDLDLIFIIDSSGSMGPVWSTVRANANSFLDQFSPTEDRVGLVHFATGAVSDIAINTTQRGFNRTVMENTITNLSNGGNTNYAEALWQANAQLNSIATSNRSSLRVVVFFSDGEPNTLAASYRMDTTTSTTTTVTTTTCNSKGKACKSTSTSSTANSTANGTTVCAGGATTNSPTSSVGGFYQINQQNTKMTGTCANLSSSSTQTSGSSGNGNQPGTFTSTTTVTTVTPTQMPAYYNAHNATDQQFAITPTSVPYVVGSTFNAQNIYNAATNVPVEMASYLRSNGVYIFTLGLDGDGGFDADLLKNMANTPDATLYNSAQPSGVYCYAANISGLKPCFSKLASEILRISK